MVNNNATSIHSQLQLASPVLFSTQPTWKPARTKEEKQYYAQQSRKGWVRQQASDAADIYGHIQAGHPIAPVFDKGVRQTINFQSAQLLLLDFDGLGQPTIDRVMTIPFIRDYAAILYETPRSTPQQPKLRVVLIYERPITDAAEYQNILRRILAHVDLTYDLYGDWSTANPAQFFFGSDKPNAVVRDLILPEQVVDSLSYSPQQIDHLRSQRLLDAQSFGKDDFIPTNGAQILAETVNSNLPPIPPDKVGMNSTVQSAPPTSDWQFDPKHINDILNALDVTNFRENGFGDAYCPFHGDDEMSAGWHRDKHFLSCRVCGDHLAKEVAAKLGLPLRSVRITPDGSLYSPPQDGLLHLPNSIREWLLQHGITHVPRLLDLLYMQGWPPHRTFSQQEISSICKQHKLDANAVKEALRVSVNGRLIFERVSSQSDTARGDQDLGGFCPSPSPNTATPAHTTSHDVGVQNPPELPKAKSGRHPTFHILPTPQELCDLLGVKNKGSDTLQLTDLGSAKSYRKAMLRELFRRRPHEYSQRFLGDILGYQEPRSVRRIIKVLKEEDGLIVESKYVKQLITYETLDLVPHGDAQSDKGKWLEDEQGKKYPPRYLGAKRMLTEGKVIYLVWQHPNLYTFNRELAVQESMNGSPSWEKPTYPLYDASKELTAILPVEAASEHEQDISVELPRGTDTSQERQMTFEDVSPEIKTYAPKGSWSNLNPFSRSTKSRGKHRQDSI